jgi:putative methyltransferase (TIGR04325 family)
LKKWTVIETPAVVARLRHVEGLPSMLTFESNLAQVTSEVDRSEILIYASGFLQCVPGGLSLLSEFAKYSRFVVIDRFPLLESDHQFVAIQRTSRILGGVGSSYPSWFFSKSSFRKACESQWRTRLTWRVPEDSPVIQGKRRPYWGFLLEEYQSIVGCVLLFTFAWYARFRGHKASAERDVTEVSRNYELVVQPLLAHYGLFPL